MATGPRLGHDRGMDLLPALAALDDPAPGAPGLEGLFDRVAADYDQSGVAFFQPIAERLVEALDVRPGERALDVGCGRGAATVRLADAVGPQGAVTAFDLSAEMVAHTSALVPDAEVLKLDAAAPDLAAHLPRAPYDVATASLVLFFLADPAAVAARWLGLLAPGGRLGLTTFGPASDLWREVDAHFVPYLPAHMRDPRIVGPDSPFATTERLEAMLTAAGATSVRTSVTSLRFTLTGPEQWLRFSLGTGQRGMWAAVPTDERQDLYDRCAALLEGARASDGTITLGQDVRCTVVTA